VAFSLALLGAVLTPAARAERLTFPQVARLVGGSPNVRLTERGLELARRTLEAAHASFTVDVSGGVRGSGGGTAEPGSASGIAVDPITLGATFNVVPVGPRATELERVRLALESAQRGVEDAYAETLLSATEGYLTALRAAQETRLARRRAEVARYALQGVRTRLRAGAAGESELLEAQLEFAQAESDRAEALQAEAEALGALALTLGTEVTAVAGSPPTGALPDAFDLAARLERRSDVQDARLALREAELAEAEARFGALPSGTVSVGYARAAEGQGVQVSASLGTESGFQPALSASYLPSAEGMSDTGALTASLGLSISLDPAVPALLEAAALGVARARETLAQARALAGLEVSTRQHELAAAEAGLALSGRQLDLSEQLLEGVQTRFALGLVAPLELRRAELARLETQLTHVRAQDTALLARLRLARALALDLREVL